jgi:hypothetical protein
MPKHRGTATPNPAYDPNVRRRLAGLHDQDHDAEAKAA